EVHVVSLSEPEQKPKMRVYWNHTRNLFIVTAFNIPRAPVGKTYQLWALVKGKAPISMGTFNPDESGHATETIQVASNIIDAGHIDNCALTLEPAGGSPQPTETPRLMGAWRHVD
ncbi:MAG: anti-sigma factor, partial [Gemmatimonadaceae bacterium]